MGRNAGRRKLTVEDLEDMALKKLGLTREGLPTAFPVGFPMGTGAPLSRLREVLRQQRLGAIRKEPRQ